MAEQTQEERDQEVRAMLEEASKTVPESLRQMVEDMGIQQTGRTMQQILGLGSESLLPSDDTVMKPHRLAAALQIWARRRLRRQQTRNELVAWARQITKVTTKLKQRLSGAKMPPELPPQRLVIFTGTTRLRFRMRNFLWADGSSQPRQFDQAFMTLAPSTSSDEELMRARTGGISGLLKGHDLGGRPVMSIAREKVLSEKLQIRVGTLLERRKKAAATVVAAVRTRDAQGDWAKNADGSDKLGAPTRTADAYQFKPGVTVDGAAIALNPPPPPMKALRLGVRNYAAEGCTGLHEKPAAPKTLAHLVDLRVKIRTVVLAMNATGDDGPPPENPIGYSEIFNGIRYQKCAEVGAPLQEAWGYAVSERLFGIWRKLNLSKDGVPYKFPSTTALERTGIPYTPSHRAPTNSRCRHHCPHPC
jgi:hypothetical protein